jgi:hypothetical protein
MTEPRRVTVISPRVFVLISVGYLVIAILSSLKYFSKHDPYYPFQAIAYVGIWLLWFCIYKRGRRSLRHGTFPEVKK